MNEYTSQVSVDLEAQKQAKQKKSKHDILDFLETIALALILYFGINYMTQRVRVENVSMLPTLHEGYLLIVNKLAYREKLPKHGDIIIFHYMGNPKEDYIKRVIGVPGDHVEIANGQVKVNGIILNEPYIMEAPKYTKVADVPEGKLFVLGDNRNDSSDSSRWSFIFVDMKWVVGKAVVLYWPLDKFQIINDPDLLVTAKSQ